MMRCSMKSVNAGQHEERQRGAARRASTPGGMKNVNAGGYASYSANAPPLTLSRGVDMGAARH
jgi:hypothetical protein